MKKKFFKNLFEKENNLQMNSINEFDVFKDIISFSKVEVYKEMRNILDDIDKKIDEEMAESVEKYHIVMGLKNQTDDITDQLSGTEEQIDVIINDAKEADIIARYSEKMLKKLLEVGFDSTDLELEKKAMTVTYSKRIMMKLDNIAKKDTNFIESKYAESKVNIENDDYNEEKDFQDIEEMEEIRFEKSNEVDNTVDSNESVDETIELNVNIYGEESAVSDKNNISEEEKGCVDMIDEKYSKEAYNLLVKGNDKEIAEERENLGKEEYDVIIREAEDDIVRNNDREEVVGEEAYEELIKGRKIKEVDEDEY